MNYFKNLPTITYNDNVAKNLLTRAKLPSSVDNNMNIYYPYTMDSNDRIDNLSYSYYDSPNYTWLIWHTNQVIDPYYDMTLADQDFYYYLESKYGSVADAQRRIAFYRTNWYTDSRLLTESDFNQLSGYEKKYWDPMVNEYFLIVGYKRKQEDRILNTNRIVTITIANLVGSFQVGEEVKNLTGSIWGTITSADSTTLIVEKTTGSFTDQLEIYGDTSGATAKVDGTPYVIDTEVTTDSMYWEAVSYFDYELEQNERKKEIYLLDNRYKTVIEQDLKRVMNTT